MRVGEFKREMRKAGCYFVRHGGDHDRWYSPITNKKFSVPRHDNDDMGPDMEYKLRKLSGVYK